MLLNDALSDLGVCLLGGLHQGGHLEETVILGTVIDERRGASTALETLIQRAFKVFVLAEGEACFDLFQVLLAAVAMDTAYVVLGWLIVV